MPAPVHAKVVIIGSGPAGYTAALSVLVLLQLAAILWLLPLRAAQPRL